MTFINLSKHPLDILAADQSVKEFDHNGRTYLALDGPAHLITSLPAWEGEVPSTSSLPGETIEVEGVSISYPAGEKVEGLPEPQQGVIYITSARNAKACPERRDVVAPGQLVFVEPHEGRGEIAGCLGLNKPA